MRRVCTDCDSFRNRIHLRIAGLDQQGNGGRCGIGIGLLIVKVTTYYDEYDRHYEKQPYCGDYPAPGLS